MIRISALNDTCSDGDSTSQPAGGPTTKEAKEAEAFALYNKALVLQRQREITRAETLFKELLYHPFMQEAVRLVNEGEEGARHPGLQLLYSTHKNMASIALQREDTKSAIESLLEAVVVDATEVTVWYKIGLLALKLHKYSLARFSFEQGLHCNPRHWPCLDHVITVLYVLNDYWHCLSYIAQALGMDSGYTKGIVIRKRIYKEHAALEKETTNFFHLCDPVILDTTVDQTEADEIINEALEMREKRRELTKIVPAPPIKLPTLANFTWKSIGQSLIALFDYISQSDPPKSLCLRIDCTAYDPSVMTPPRDIEMATEKRDTDKNRIDSEQEFFSDLEKMEHMEVNTPEIVPPSSEDNEPPPQLRSETDLPFLPRNENIPPSILVITETEAGSGQREPRVMSGEGEHPRETTSQVLISDNPAKTSQPPVSAEVALQDHTVAMDSDDTGPGSKRGMKRKRLSQLENPGQKRRSARVRNTNKKKEDETINFQELLQKFLPSSLVRVEETEEDEMDVQTGEDEVKQAGGQAASDGTTLGTTNPPSDRGCLSHTEEVDVQQFLMDEQRNCGIVSMMKNYLYFLGNHDTFKWTAGLREIYMEIYSRARPHFRFPDCPGNDDADELMKAKAKICLVYVEMKLDSWLSRKVKVTPSPAAPTGSPRKSPQLSVSVLGLDFPGAYYTDDFQFLCAMIGYSPILGDFWAEHAIRTYWAQSRFHALQNKMDDAVGWFDMTSMYLKYAAEKEDLHEVHISQCTVDNIITEDQVSKQLDSLQRCQSLEEVQKLYESEEYQKVVDCLLQTFTQPQTKGKLQVVGGDAIPERHAQLLLLQDSLFKLNDSQKCILWGEESLNEALQHYRLASGSGHEEWGSTLTQIFGGLNKCLSRDGEVIRSLPSVNLVRLTQNLIWLIEMTVESSESVTLHVDSVLPWILLYKLIKHEEKKLHALLVGEGASNTEDLDGAITSSFMLLNVAHEYLGRRSWCTNSNGVFLKFFIDMLRQEMSRYTEDKPALFMEETNQAFEQCTFCLYGYPNKKSRVKYLQDHSSSQISLTWEKAIDLFEYFKPKTVPEFDSYKTSTVSGELAALLRRISSLVPDQYKAGNTTDWVQQYIEGNADSPPTGHADKCTNVPVVRELYYLLADYYFKNKEQMKAIKFYMLDLCYNPERLDSWAGMALARMSRLEQKLNLHEWKMDTLIQKQSIMSLRCFCRAVETDDSNSNLWIEYGSLAYQLHSHASRQLKMKHWFPLGEETLRTCGESRKDMLQIAQNCYRKANECESDGNEEEWLHHYMMGKVAEKTGKSPQEYLEHFSKAAVYTHEDQAVYPKKITYVVSPPHLAVEALEVFYRLHASILKLLLQNSKMVDYKLLEKFLKQAAESPFAQGKEKKSERKEGRESASSGPDESFSGALPMTPTKGHHKYHVTPQDHNYSRQKSGDGRERIHINELNRESVQTSDSQSESSEWSPSRAGAVRKIVIGENREESTGPTITPRSKSTSFLMADILGKASTKPSTDIAANTDYLASRPNPTAQEQDHNKQSPTDTAQQQQQQPDSSQVPSDQSQNQPSDPSQNQPSDPSQNQPSDPSQNEKSDPLQKQPSYTSKQATSDPSGQSQLDVSTPSQPDVTSVKRENLQSDLPSKPQPEPDVIDLTSPVKATKPRVIEEKSMEVDEVFQNAADETAADQKGEDSGKTVEGSVVDMEMDSKNDAESTDKTGQGELSREKRSSEDSCVPGSEVGPAVKDVAKKAEELKDVDYGPPGFDNPKHKELMDMCVSALQLCLSRFPQHYKSVYRLAHVYFYSSLHKNVQYSRDLLLGNTNWQQLEHMPAPGLYADRKHTDFFKGVWRIPIDEIDRSGSFPSHLNRSIQLVLEVLREQKDCSTLLQIHHQLSRVPDLGKKFLRDAERVCFAKQAYDYALHAGEAKAGLMRSETNQTTLVTYLMEVFRLWNYGVNKMFTYVDRVNDLFASAYRIVCNDKVVMDAPILDQALYFCQEQISLTRSQALATLGSPRQMLNKSGFLSPSHDRSHDFLQPTSQGGESGLFHRSLSNPGQTSSPKDTQPMISQSLISKQKVTNQLASSQFMDLSTSNKNPVSNISNQPSKPTMTSKPGQMSSSSHEKVLVCTGSVGQKVPVCTGSVGQVPLSVKLVGKVDLAQQGQSSSDSLLSRMVKQPGQILTDVSKVINRSQVIEVKAKPTDRIPQQIRMVTKQPGSSSQPRLMTVSKPAGNQPNPLSYVTKSPGNQPNPVSYVAKAAGSQPNPVSYVTKTVTPAGQCPLQTSRIETPPATIIRPSASGNLSRPVSSRSKPVSMNSPGLQMLPVFSTSRSVEPAPVLRYNADNPIVIDDSSDSHDTSLSDLLDYTIELNDSDLDDPIVISDPDQLISDLHLLTQSLESPQSSP